MSREQVSLSPPGLERWNAAAVSAGAAIALLTLACRGFYTRWISDDYLLPMAYTTHGFWRGQAWWYREWSGRFAFNFVATALGALGPRTASLALPATIGIFIVALRRPLGLALALATTYVILLGTSDVPQSVLWGGIVTYGLPLAAFAWWLATTSTRTEARWIDFVLPLFTGGFSETGVLAQILGCAVAVACWRRKPHVAGFCGSLVSLFVIAVAPGNAVRHSRYPPVAPVATLLARSTMNTLMFFFDAITRCGLPLLFLFCASALLAPHFSKKLVAAAVMWAIGTAFAAQIAAQAALSIPLPSRAEIVLYATLAGAVMALGTLLPKRRTLRAPLSTALLIACVIPLIDAAATGRTIPSARRFALSWDRLDRVCRQARGRDVVVRGAPAAVGTLHFIPHNAAGQNRVIAAYYGLRSIASEPVVPPAPPDPVHVDFKPD